VIRQDFGRRLEVPLSRSVILSTNSRPTRLVSDGENALALLAKHIGDSVDFATLAEMLGVNLSTVHRWRLDGKLQGAWRLGGRWRVPASS
jgi:Helix-turn-helix domain